MKASELFISGFTHIGLPEINTLTTGMSSASAISLAMVRVLGQARCCCLHHGSPAAPRLCELRGWDGTGAGSGSAHTPAVATGDGTGDAVPCCDQ